MAKVDIDTDTLYWAFGGKKVDKRTKEFKALKKRGVFNKSTFVPNWFSHRFHKAFYYNSQNTINYLLTEANDN